MDIKIKIDKTKVLKYMDAKNSNLMISAEVDKAISNTYNIITPKHLMQEHLIAFSDKGVVIEGTNVVLKGEDVAKHLENCYACAFLCLSLGTEIDKNIDTIQQKSVLSALAHDAASVVALNDYTNRILSNVAAAKLKLNEFITNSLGFGCGDLAIEQGYDVLKILNAQKFIGVSINNNFIMSPKKTLNLIIGISKSKLPTSINPTKKCGSCKGGCCKNKQKG